MRCGCLERRSLTEGSPARLPCTTDELEEVFVHSPAPKLQDSKLGCTVRWRDLPHSKVLPRCSRGLRVPRVEGSILATGMVCAIVVETGFGAHF